MIKPSKNLVLRQSTRYLHLPVFQQFYGIEIIDIYYKNPLMDIDIPIYYLYPLTSLDIEFL